MNTSGIAFLLSLAAIMLVACTPGDEEAALVPTGAKGAPPTPAEASRAAEAAPTHSAAEVSTPAADRSVGSSPAFTPVPTVNVEVAGVASEGPVPAGRIAFASPDSQIYVVRPEGADLTRVSPPRAAGTTENPSAGYTWPVWSPDGEQIIFSAAEPPASGSTPRYAVLSVNADGTNSEDPIRVYENEPGTGLIVASAPHYALWSPDGRKLALIVARREGLTLMVAEPGTGRTRNVIAGAPLYMSWSPDSSSLLVHSRDRLFEVTDSFTGAPRGIPQGRTTNYFAPDYSPTDQRAAFLWDSDSGQVLTVRSRDGRELSPLSEVDSIGFFRWSPKGDSLALLRGTPQEGPGQSELLIVSPSGGTERVVADGRFQAFQWSPDGDKLLLTERPERNTRIMRWWVVDAATGERETLVEFEPTAEFGLMHQFFDQFNASHSVWSPDSRWVLFTGILLNPEPLESQITRGEDTIWLVDTESDSRPAPLASGFLAFWSPK